MRKATHGQKYQRKNAGAGKNLHAQGSSAFTVQPTAASIRRRNFIHLFETKQDRRSTTNL